MINSYLTVIDRDTQTKIGTLENRMRLILYSKPGCHLCEGLQEKLNQIESIALDLEIRDITTREIWFQAYQYEIPVLYLVQQEGDREEMKELPRLSPRASVQQLERMLQNYLVQNKAE